MTALLLDAEETDEVVTGLELVDVLRESETDDELGVPKIRLELLVLLATTVWLTAAGATVRSEMSLMLSGAGLTSTRSRMTKEAVCSAHGKIVPSGGALTPGDGAAAMATCGRQAMLGRRATERGQGASCEEILERKKESVGLGGLAMESKRTPERATGEQASWVGAPWRGGRF